MRILGEGPIPSRLMIVGEAPSEQDKNSPFGGYPGMELNRLLHEAGILRSECYVTYVSKLPPPNGYIPSLTAEKKNQITPAHVFLKGHHVLPQVAEGYAELLTEIEMVQPNLIIAMGNLALWALTDNWSVAKWRGSLLGGGEGPKVIPTYHPSQIPKQFELRGILLNDLRRAKRHMTSRVYDNIPDWKFQIRPTFEQATRVLHDLRVEADRSKELWLEFDLETFITTKHIRCAGISWSRTEAICVPLTDGQESYWNADQEGHVVYLLYKLLTHPRVKVRGQNLLFDCQYTYRYWHFIPNVAHDTMISQHSCFCALPKGLDFLASMYADYYCYWKEDK